MELFGRHCLIVTAGLLVGGIGGMFASMLSVPYPTCTPTAEMFVDPLLGLLFGIWYCYALVERTEPTIRLWQGGHILMDTLLGCVLGYHFALGLQIAVETRNLLFFPWVLFGLYSLSIIGLGALFFWSTSRWIKRMEHDDPRIFINGKPYDRHLHSHGSPGPD